MTTAPSTRGSVTVDETIALVRRCCRPLPPEPVPLGEALGRVLRQDVLAPEDQPPFDRSAVDGYAVRADDTSVRFRVVESLRAGDWKPFRLQEGEAAQIATGAALLGKGVRVLKKEEVRRDGGEIVVLERALDPNIRWRGEDARAGSVLVRSGTALSPGALALLASAGCGCPLVTALPRVLHEITGDEIVPPLQTPAPGQVRDSNSTLVRAFLTQWGIVPKQRRVGELEMLSESGIRNPKLVPRRAKIKGRRPKPAGRNPPLDGEAPNLWLISGGASVGEHDFTARRLEQAGYRIRVRRTSARPGKPLLFATRGPAVAFGLPGNPLAHFVCLNLYVRAALDGFGRVAEPDGFGQGALARNLDAGANERETLWPARLAFRGGKAELDPLRWRSSGDITCLAVANALVRIPAGCGRLARGAAVAFLPTAPRL